MLHQAEHELAVSLLLDATADQDMMRALCADIDLRNGCPRLLIWCTTSPSLNYPDTTF